MNGCLWYIIELELFDLNFFSFTKLMSHKEGYWLISSNGLLTYRNHSSVVWQECMIWKIPRNFISEAKSMLSSRNEQGTEVLFHMLIYTCIQICTFSIYSLFVPRYTKLFCLGKNEKQKKQKKQVCDTDQDKQEDWLVTGCDASSFSQSVHGLPCVQYMQLIKSTAAWHSPPVPQP